MTQATYVPDVAHTKSQALSFFEAVLAAIASSNSGPNPPTETYPYMFFYNTTTGVMEVRNGANSGWINLRDFIGAQAALGFTPVQQGGGLYQGNNKVYLGWDGPAGRLRYQIDGSDQGLLARKDEIPAAYTDAQARSAQAGHNPGEVGSYAFMFPIKLASPPNIGPGNTFSGSDLQYTNAQGAVTSITASGTWKLFGWVSLNSDFPEARTSLWMRIV